MSRYKVPELSKYEFQKAVLSILSSPPLSPSRGDRYIVGSGATGVWSDKVNQIAEFDSSWEYTIPFRGMMVYVVSYDRYLQYTTFWDELISIGKEIIVPENSGKVLTTSDFGKSFTCENSSSQIFYLPSIDSSHVGYWFRFVKLGSGILTIQAADQDTIADSGPGKTIYNNNSSQDWATLKLILMSDTKWTIDSGHGTWVTTI